MAQELRGSDTPACDHKPPPPPPNDRGSQNSNTPLVTKPPIPATRARAQGGGDRSAHCRRCSGRSRDSRGIGSSRSEGMSRPRSRHPEPSASLASGGLDSGTFFKGRACSASRGRWTPAVPGPTAPRSAAKQRPELQGCPFSSLHVFLHLPFALSLRPSPPGGSTPPVAPLHAQPRLYP